MSAGLLFMLLVVALGMMAVGYGLWSKVLTIQGEVRTGEVNAEFSIEEIDQGDIGQLSDNGMDEHKEVEGKLIANCEVTLEDGLPNPGPQTLKVVIERGYPSFWCIVNFDVENTGTIPIRVEQPNITFADPGLFVNFGFSTGIGGEPCYFDETEDGSAIEGTIDDHPQLEPGGIIEPNGITYCTLWVHVEQEAAQGATLNFEATICVHQWNEEPGDKVACTAAP
ncbi:MAG: hypothetical protein IIA90_02650 [Chloroflexi bacterium]|nr:hypothetical protein [Chloroflexota bacterium]